MQNRYELQQWEVSPVAQWYACLLYTSWERGVKGHAAHIRQVLRSHCADVNAFHLFQFLNLIAYLKKLDSFQALDNFIKSIPGYGQKTGGLLIRKMCIRDRDISDENIPVIQIHNQERFDKALIQYTENMISFL